MILAEGGGLPEPDFVAALLSVNTALRAELQKRCREIAGLHTTIEQYKADITEAMATIARMTAFENGVIARTRPAGEVGFK